MIGIASRYFAGRVTLVTAAAVVLGIATGMDGEGNVALYGVIVLGVAACAFALLAGLALSVGDDDSADRERHHRHPTTPAYWPLMSALGLGLLMVGLVVDGIFTIFGVALLIIAAVEWTGSAWADGLSSDLEANAAARGRLLAPFEIPLYGVLGIAVPVVLVSRVFLALSRNGASYAALAIGAVVIVIAFTFSAKPNLRRSIVATVLAAAVTAVIVGGIVSAAIGERDFHPHEEEHESEEGHEEGAAVLPDLSPLPEKATLESLS